MNFHCFVMTLGSLQNITEFIGFDKGETNQTRCAKRARQFPGVLCWNSRGNTNKYNNIRAALCWEVSLAELAKQHNNANVMTIGSRLTKEDVALRCVSAFLKTNFDGGRHLKRVKKI